jgi:putative Ca2+/H+ antiporter (TMEM165/GDT1 family)
MLTGFTAALLLITVSELGDKTFFISVIMAMRYPRRYVFLGAIAALIAMTILSVLLGQFVAFLPKKYTTYGAIALFIFFGAKLLWDAWRMEELPDADGIEEAETAIAKSKKKHLSRHPQGWAIMVETFILTFLAEWGDRTQVATIVLAAANNPVGVTIGAIFGHAICALIAVFGGKFIAGRISERKVTAIGGMLFFVFAGVSLMEVG